MKKTILFSIILLLFVSHHAEAVDWRYTLFSNIRYSDNLSQTLDEIEGYALNAGITFSLNDESGTEFSYTTSGLLGATTFSEEIIDNQYIRGFNGNFLYHPKNTNFTLLAVENIAQVPQDRFVTQEINNIRDVEVTAIKPSYFLKLTGADQLNFDYSIVIVDASDSNATINAQDGSRQLNEYSFSYEHQISAINSLSIIGRKSDTDYDDPFDLVNLTGVDYEQEDVFARWIINGQSNLLRFDAGVSTVKTKLDRTIEVDLIQLLYRRQLNRTQALSLTFRKGFDSIFNFELGTNNINVNNRSGDFGNTLNLKEHRVDYEINEDFFTGRLSYFNVDLDTALSPNSEIRKGADLRLTYRLSRVLGMPFDTNITFSYFNSRNEFDSTLTQVTKNEVESYNLFLNYFISQDTFLFLQLQQRNSDSFILDTPSASIDSKTLFVGISYSPNGRIEN